MTNRSFKKHVYNKQQISAKRKVANLYSSGLSMMKITIIVFACIFIFTNVFSGAKRKVADKFYEISANYGFKIDKIVIEGTDNVPESDIIASIDAKKGDSIFSLNIAKIQKNIEDNSWVKKVLVERRMPNTLYIAVSEKQPIALWQHKQKLALIDEFGDKISERNIDKFANLPHLIGGNANICAKQFLATLETHPDLAKHVLYAVRYGNRRWDLVMQEDITVKMPETDFSGAYEYLYQLFEKDLLFTKNMKMLDLRHQDKVFFEEDGK